MYRLHRPCKLFIKKIPIQMMLKQVLSLVSWIFFIDSKILYLRKKSWKIHYEGKNFFKRIRSSQFCSNFSLRSLEQIRSRKGNTSSQRWRKRKETKNISKGEKHIGSHFGGGVRSWQFQRSRACWMLGEFHKGRIFLEKRVKSVFHSLFKYG